MGRKTWIAVITVFVVMVGVVAGAYAYDSSQKDKIADGVTVAGVDVAGMNSEEAAAAVRRQLLAPLRHPLTVSYKGESWTLPGAKLKLRADVDGAVEEAVDASQEGGLPSRLVRYVTGGSVDKSIAAEVDYSRPAITRFVRNVAAEVNREPEDASVEPNSDGLEVVAAKDGRKLRDNKLTDELENAVLNADAGHAITASVHSTQPKVTTKEVASALPVLPDPGPQHLHPATLEELETGQDLHRRGRPGRPRNSGRALPHPGKGRKSFLARSRLRLGR